MEYTTSYTLYLLDYLFYIVIVWPPITFISTIIGTLFMQKVKTPTAIKYITFDRATYRKKILGAYLAIMAIIVIREVLQQNFWGFSPDNTSGSYIGLGMLLVMGVIANYSAKRLRGMGYSHYWALLCAVPLVGPLMELWLAFTNRTKAPITSPDVFS